MTEGVLDEENRMLSKAGRGDLANKGSKVWESRRWVCWFQELINLLTVVCIDMKGSGCKSFEGGREAMINSIFWMNHNYGILPVSVPHCWLHCGQNSFSHRAAVKSIQNQSKHRFIYLSPYLRKLVFNNYDYDEQALLNKLAGTIFQKWLINSILQH